MHLNDLQILVIGHIDRESVDALLWDAMPGGSGLLEQILNRFQEIIKVAKDITGNCPSACDHSCVDCLQSFRNGYYHKHLDRRMALDQFEKQGDTLVEENIIPAHGQVSAVHADSASQPVNDAETKLKHLLRRAGFMDGDFQRQVRFKEPINLDGQIGSTTPDVFYVSEDGDDEEKGLCIYLDGLSSSIHGNQEAFQRDQEIRTWLRNNGYQVIEITVVELDDHKAMVRHFKRLARFMSGRDMAKKIEENNSWFH